MIASFSISGYRSYKEEAVLSLNSGNVSENQDSLLYGGYLPAVLVFGPNGSGKSTLLKALEGIVSLVSLPLLEKGDELRLLSGDGDSSFSLSYTSSSHLYRYSLGIADGEIRSEKLERLAEGEGRSTVLFARSGIGVRCSGDFRAYGSDDVPSDIPFLSLLKAEHPDSDAVDEAFRGIAEAFSFPRTASLSKLGEKSAESVLASLDLADAEGSSGREEVVRSLPAIITALECGRTAVIDGFLPSLHPLLKEHIIRLFTSGVSNPNGASIILSSCDASLLDTKLLRRDEIYLTEKHGGMTTLSRLSAIKDRDGQSVRKDARIQRGYLAGDYGAMPELKAIKAPAAKERDGKRKLFSINNRRYLGNKFRITRFIREIVDEHCPGASSFADIFSGTGSVSYAFRDRKLILNDFLYSNYLSNLAWFSPEHFDREKLETLIDGYNAMEADEDNYMSDNFSDTYFSRSNCRRIGAIREDIERRFRRGELNMRERAMLVVSLLYAMDRIAATCGHYDAWRENADLSAVLEMRMLDADESNNGGNEIFSEDANALVKHISADIVYIDPPYNSRQYSDAYHLLENVARWEKPDVKGKARKMDRKAIKSLYSTNRAEAAFSDLIASIDAKYILLSYNNMHDKGDSRSNAKITDKTIMSVLCAKGEVSVFSTTHRAFSAGRSSIEGNEERIFLCRVRKPEHERTGIIESPLNYIGGKGRIIGELLDAFPREIDTFVDLFAGGCTVGINAPARRVIFNDSDSRLVSLLREMRRCDKEAFLSDIFSLIDEYGLSRSDLNGYAYYGADSSKGLGSANKEGFTALRRDFNTLSLDEHRRAVMLYVLIVYGFNNQIRFNDDGAFNLPVGKRDFNRRMQEKLSAFMDRLATLDAVFLDSDFRTVEIPSGSFVYADPPYLVTTATYNEKHGWTESDETSLHALLENLTERSIRFALSNTLRSRGRENTFLLEWLDKHPEYRVIHIDRSYANSNYHIKDREAESDEVLILNY